MATTTTPPIPDTTATEELPFPGGPPLLRATGMSKHFGPVEALVDVDFEVHAGEVVALVGDNGAGKSTLIKAIAGVQPADSGTIAVDGERVTIRNASDAYRHGIATVYQDLALCDNLDVVANLFLGGEMLTGTRALDERAMEHKTIELLDSLGVTSPASVRAQIGSLSGGQRQSVAIARSLLGEPRLVILDEPTAALGVLQTAQVLELVRRLRENGLGVVVISHNLENVYSVADRIVVLRLARVARPTTAVRRRARRSSPRSPAPRTTTWRDAPPQLHDPRGGDRPEHRDRQPRGARRQHELEQRDRVAHAVLQGAERAVPAVRRDHDALGHQRGHRGVQQRPPAAGEGRCPHVPDRGQEAHGDRGVPGAEREGGRPERRGLSHGSPRSGRCRSR
jgi:D-xylose transport system ATP-binding protein